MLFTTPVVQEENINKYPRTRWPAPIIYDLIRRVFICCHATVSHPRNRSNSRKARHLVTLGSYHFHRLASVTHIPPLQYFLYSCPIYCYVTHLLSFILPLSHRCTWCDAAAIMSPSNNVCEEVHEKDYYLKATLTFFLCEISQLTDRAWLSKTGFPGNPSIIIMPLLL